MPDRYLTLGFEEVSPHQLIHNMLSLDTESNSTDRHVAILSRFASSPGVQEYVSQLAHNGFVPRVVSNQSAVQDFCFLLQSNVVVGAAKSTYLLWAGLLGSSRKIYAYSINSTHTRQRAREKRTRYDFSHTFHRSDLRDKWRFLLLEQ